MRNSTMRAVQAFGRGKIEIIDTPVPEVPKGHALVQPLLISICGTDLYNIYHKEDDCYPLPPGVSGHEVIARVVSMNQDILNQQTDHFHYPGGPVNEGDLVLALVPIVENAMGEYVIAEIDNLLPLPPGPPEQMVLAQQLGTVIYACKRLPNIVGKNAVVIGQGSAGLFFNVMLKRMGAEKIVAMDISDARAAMGGKFGATTGFNNHTADPKEAVAKEIGPRGADLVVEAVGVPETFNLMSKLVKTHGLQLYFGVPHPSTFEIDVMEWYRKCTTTIACVGASEDPGNQCFLLALDMIASGEVDPAPMVTHAFDFEEVAKAYQLAYTREDCAGKVLVKMPAFDEYIGSESNLCR